MNILEKVEKVIIYLLFLVFPLAFSNLFINSFDTTKLFVLIIGIFLILFIKLIKFIGRKNLDFNVGKYDLVVFLLMMAYLLSGIFASKNILDSFFNPGMASFVILGGIMYFITNQLDKESKQKTFNFLAISAFTISLLQITSFIGILKLIPQLPEYIKDVTFNTFGNILNQIVFLAAILPFTIFNIFKKEEMADKILNALVSIVLVIGFSISIFLLISNHVISKQMLDYNSSWSIAIDTLKSSPYLGAGPSKYVQSFNKFKPLKYNLSENWNLEFQQGSNMILTTFTEIGFIGLILLLVLLILPLTKIDYKNANFISFTIILIASFSLPYTLVVIPIILFLFSYSIDTKGLKLGFFTSKLPITLISIPFVSIFIVAIYIFSRAFYAEYVFTKSFVKLSTGNGKEAYQLINKAISINQLVDRYHLFSSAINMAIVDNIAKKEKIEDKDKEDISKLIQQSIAEGKAVVKLNPNKASSWLALANIYTKIINYAKGSESFAIESYKQAINLDPINPITRIKLGILYYNLGRYEEAIETLKLAVLSKPDYPNSRFNLALAYKANKQLEKSKTEINNVLLLLGKEAKDYEVALKELQGLEELTKKDDSLVTPEQAKSLPQE
jgi:tetratricopeptide (TPR) repeat protein